MKVLAVVGDRFYNNFEDFSRALDEEIQKTGSTELVTGDCSGVDTMVYDYGSIRGVPVTVFCASSTNYARLTADGARAVLVADWKRQGAAAGPIRNRRLLKAADSVLLFDGGGKGSASVRTIAKELGKKIERKEVNGEGNVTERRPNTASNWETEVWG